jgi:signal peptidase II
VTQATDDGPAVTQAPDQSKAIKPLLLMFCAALITLAVDQFSKAAAVRYLSGGEIVSLVGSVLRFRLVRNPGAAFSMGETFTWAFTVLATGVVIGVVVMARRIRSRAWALTLGLLAAGAAGNLADRLFRAPSFGRGHVVDFIDYGGRFVGNVADIAIVGAMLLLVFFVLRGISLDGSRR